MNQQILKNFVDRSRIKIALVSAVSLSWMVATVGFAVPSPYVTQWKETGIVNKTSAVLMRDTASEKRIWVMPPSVGNAKVKRFTPTSEVLGCTGYKKAILSLSELSSIVAETDNGKAALQVQRDQVYTEKEAKMRLLEEKKKHPDLEKLAKMKDQQLRLDDKLSELENAAKISSSDGEKKRLQEEYRQLKLKSNQLDDEIYEFDLSLSTLTAEIKSLIEQIKNRDLELTELATRMAMVDASMKAARESVQAIVDQYNGLNAGVLGMDYDSGWTKTLASLQNKYPAYQFQPIETRNASIAISVAGRDNAVEAGIRGVLSYSINGLSAKKSTNGSIALAMVPDALAGDFNITLNLACPMLDKDGYIEGGKRNPMCLFPHLSMR